MLLPVVMLLHYGTSAQKVSLDSLEVLVYTYNNSFEYDKSISLLSQLLADPKAEPDYKSKLYLYKAYTYKRLFNYGQVMYNIDLARREAEKTSEPDPLLAEIKAEKSYALFDTQAFDEAEKLTKELEGGGFHLLSPYHVGMLLLQNSFFCIKRAEYDAAEQYLNDAIALAEEHAPQDLPLYYGKKIHLYNAIGRYDLRDSAFNEGYRIASKEGIVKYQLYLYEVLKGALYSVEDYPAALEAQQKFDSLAYLYDQTGYAGKTQLLERQLEDDKKLKEIARQKQQKAYLLFAVLLLLALMTILYFYRGRERRSRMESTDPPADILDLSRYDLTVRQREIISLVQQGKSNKEIAEHLFISENTVKYHLKSIYEMLNVTRRSQLQPFYYPPKSNSN